MQPIVVMGRKKTSTDRRLEASFFKQRQYQRQDIFGNDLVSGGGGVGPVGLHHAGDAVDALEQKGKHGDVVLLGEQRVGCVELLDVVGAVVGREGDAGEHDL